MNKLNNRDHDGFFKYVYSLPENARALLELASMNNLNLKELLADIDLTSLERLPSTYNNVGERGEADVAFKAKADGKDVYVGLLLEHKSYNDRAVFSQIARYLFNVMVEKNDSEFPWMPSKAVIIYNGNENWDPLANFCRKNRAKFQGKDLPFECVLVNLAGIVDEDCVAAENAEAAIGVLTMKYAFNAGGFEARLGVIENLLRRLTREAASLMIEKIKVYLGEYISKEALMELEEEFVSIGQRLGFVSAGDERRAAERKIRLLEAENAANRAEIQASKAEILMKNAEIAALKAALAAKS